MQKEHGLNIMIVFLTALALVLGYFIYQKVNLTKQQPDTASTPSAAFTPTAGVQTPSNKVSCEGINARSFLRAPPSASASEEENKRYAEVIRCLAKTGEEISFNDKCEANPPVSALPGYKVNIKNQGKSKIEVRVITAKGEGVAHPIDPGQTQLFDLTGSTTTFHMTSCYQGNQRNLPDFDGRAAVILTQPR